MAEETKARTTDERRAREAAQNPLDVAAKPASQTPRSGRLGWGVPVVIVLILLVALVVYVFV